jgi:hypothetical protein
LACKANSDEALELLSSESDGVFQSLRSTAMGDILWSLDEMDCAFVAYEKARTLSEGSFKPPRLDEKLKFLNPGLLLSNSFTQTENLDIKQPDLQGGE